MRWENDSFRTFFSHGWPYRAKKKERVLIMFPMFLVFFVHFAPPQHHTTHTPIPHACLRFFLWVFSVFPHTRTHMHTFTCNRLLSCVWFE